MARNAGCEYRETVAAWAEGMTLEAFLSARHPHSTAAAWRARIEAGRVLVDCVAARPESEIRRGQSIVWRRPPWSEPDVAERHTVLHEDDSLLAVAKPAGLPTLPGAGFLATTLLHRVRAHAPEAAPLHRLGRWTSGIVLFARTRAARADLARQWAERSVHKRYRALASGRPATASFRVEVPIGPVPHPLLGTVHAASVAGRPAVSTVRVVERRGSSFLCDVEIETGRPHQVRVHLAAAGFPLVGDPLYGPGGGPVGARAVPGDPGYLLHAAELGFRHPCTLQRMTIACSPPPVLMAEVERPR